MIKSNFVVSELNYDRTLQKSPLYLCDPYLAYVFKDKLISADTTGDYVRIDKRDYIEDVNYLDLKFTKYIKQITFALNQIHNTNHEEIFWKKALSLGILRFVHLAYNDFKYYERFDARQHQIDLLGDFEHLDIFDFESHREIFQHEDIGREASFALYIATFHPDLYLAKEKFSLMTECKATKPVSISTPIKGGFFKRLFSVSPYKVFYRIFKKRKPVVAIIDSYFSSENFQKLVVKSLGRINKLSPHLKKIEVTNVNMKKRNVLSDYIEIEDKFDKYFGQYLKCFFPKIFLEGFKEHFNAYTVELEKVLPLKGIISESWISNSQLALFLAVAKQHGIKHINNEHNYLEHFLVGNHIKYLSSIVDVYYTIGWYNDFFHNICAGASLYEFTLNKKGKKKLPEKKQIFYVSSVCVARLSEINCSYGEQEEYAPRYIHFIKTFFNKLNINVRQKLIFRKYPNNNWKKYNLDDFLTDEFSTFKEMDNFNLSVKEMIWSSELTIIDYLSTAFLEALLSGKPFVFFHDKSRHVLSDDFINIFDDLVKVKICFHSSSAAAEHINHLVLNDGIKKWWSQVEVQETLKQFRHIHVGPTSKAFEYYLSLLK